MPFGLYSRGLSGLKWTLAILEARVWKWQATGKFRFAHILFLSVLKELECIKALCLTLKSYLSPSLIWVTHLIPHSNRVWISYYRGEDEPFMIWPYMVWPTTQANLVVNLGLELRSPDSQVGPWHWARYFKDPSRLGSLRKFPLCRSGWERTLSGLSSLLSSVQSQASEYFGFHICIRIGCFILWIF